VLHLFEPRLGVVALSHRDIRHEQRRLHHSRNGRALSPRHPRRSAGPHARHSVSAIPVRCCIYYYFYFYFLKKFLSFNVGLWNLKYHAVLFGGDDSDCVHSSGDGNHRRGRRSFGIHGLWQICLHGCVVFCWSD
jgi:hypothetical protein